VGYLLFAGAAWLAGAVLSRLWSGRLWIYGLIQLLLAAALVAYAAGWPRCSGHAPAATPLVQIDEGPKPLPIGAVVLGFLTGLSLCPPFLIAGVRAAQLPSLPMALVFFALFFAGTAAWFLPLLTLGIIRRAPQLRLVARMTALLVAVYYGLLGMHALLTRIAHG
jgi:hypothetical protein